MLSEHHCASSRILLAFWHHTVRCPERVGRSQFRRSLTFLITSHSGWCGGWKKEQSYFGPRRSIGLFGRKCYYWFIFRWSHDAAKLAIRNRTTGSVDETSGASALLVSWKTVNVLGAEYFYMIARSQRISLCYAWQSRRSRRLTWQFEDRVNKGVGCACTPPCLANAHSRENVFL